MENNRPRISSLSEKELAALLTESFFKIGKGLKLPANETKIFLSEIYKNQGWMYIDVFNDAFSRYAACELPEAENLHPQVSPMFVSKLMKLSFKKQEDKNHHTKSTSAVEGTLNAREKYTLFLKHILANKCLPANPDWVSIYEHLSGIKKLSLLPEWDSLSYCKKLKQAMLAVSEWTYNNFTITENLMYKTTKGTLKGMGTRLGESFR